MISGYYQHKEETYACLGRVNVQGKMKQGILLAKNGELSVVTYSYFKKNYRKTQWSF